VSDLSDLQKQVLDERAALLRAWSLQESRKPTTGDLATSWNDLASRGWDFGHESQSLLDASGQDNRGRGLLAELATMRTRFEAEGIGKEAMPTTPFDATPSLNPANKGMSFGGFLGELPPILLIVALFLVMQKTKGLR